MAIKPQLRDGTGFNSSQVLAFGLAGILGVPVGETFGLLVRAKVAAKDRAFESVGPEPIPFRMDETCPGHDDDAGFGFHATTFEEPQPEDLAGVWSLRCVSAATTVSNGAAELSRGDLRILLRFKGRGDGSDTVRDWTAIHKVWEGPAYDADIEELHL